MTFIKGRFSSKVVFYQRLSYIKGYLPSNVVFHQRLSSIKCCLTSKVIFHQRVSSIKECLPSMVIFHQRLSSIRGHFPSKVIFYQRLSSIQGQRYHNTLVHLIFVSKVNILMRSTNPFLQTIRSSDLVSWNDRLLGIWGLVIFWSLFVQRCFP